MAKRVSAQRVKIHRQYTYEAAADVLGVTPQTVRAWRSAGLVVLDSQKPHLILGHDLKSFLQKQKNNRTGKPLAHSTVDATLRLVKGFFHWLVSQSGYKRVLTYADVEYFNNTLKAGRIAHTKRAIPHPSMQQAEHAFQAMPCATEFDRRDKALFALLMLIGARDGAVASLKLKHVNADLGHVYQDAREVNTKGAKTIHCQFLPVDASYRACITEWIQYLTDVKLFGPEDALFPKAKIGVVEGQGFTNLGLSREGYAGSAKINAVVRAAFAAVQMPQYTPHALRKTLVKFGDAKCTTMEEWKAWSMNLGHENMATTFNSYLPVTTERQMELIRKMSE